MNFKHFFCRHIWKNIEFEFLRKYTHNYGLLLNYVSVYALKQRCIKCGKERIKETESERRETVEELIERTK